MTSSVLVMMVQAEPENRNALGAALQAGGYRTLKVESGAAALAQLGGDPGPQRPSLVLLDLELPDMDGFEVIRRMRAISTVPIVVLSACDDERGKVAALDLGADDYVTRRCGAEELGARLRAALRHRMQQDAVSPAFRSGDLMVDLVRRIVIAGGRAVHLSPREYEILRLMVMNAGRVLTHDMIMEQLWGCRRDAQQLRVYVRQLRQKIEIDAARPRYILTERGVGYRLETDA